MNSHQPKVTVVEDDADLRHSIVDYLTHLGYPCRGAGSVEEYWREAAAHPANVVVVDVELPGENGFSLARQLQTSAAPIGIVMLTGRGELEDRLTGLESGADIYLVKPVDLRELAANINAAARRVFKHAAPPTGHWQLIRAERRWVAPYGSSVILTGKEFLFLSLLSEAPETSVSRDELITRLWGQADLAGGNRLDVLVYRLRRKCAPLLGTDIPVMVVHGLGYRLSSPCWLV